MFDSPMAGVLPLDIPMPVGPPPQAAAQPAATATCPLEGRDLSELDTAALTELIVELERHIARLAAVQLAAVALLGADDAYGEDTQQYLREEVSTLCRVGQSEAHRRMVTALQLSRLPALQGALSRGEVTLAQATATAVELEAVPDDLTAAQLAEELTAKLAKRSPWQAHNAAEKLAQTACPEIAKKAETDRSHPAVSWVGASVAGRTMMWADLTNDDASIVAHALDAYAVPTGPQDARTIDHRRADALVEISRLALREGGDTGLPGRAHLQVIVPVGTLLGGREPGHLSDGSLVGPAAARRHSCDALISRLLVDPTSGALLDVGRTQRVVPDGLRRFVIARDRQCQFPYCGRPPARCDIHHIVPWSHGGATDADNLVLLCSRHHHAVHEAGWTVERLSGGSHRWTSPAGQSHHSPPSPYLDEATTDTALTPGEPADSAVTHDEPVPPEGVSPEPADST
jgi:hypothetical protein